MKRLQSIIIFLGRLFLSLIFILSAINKILDWQETERGLVAVLCDWNSYVTLAFFQKMFTALLPWGNR